VHVASGTSDSGARLGKFRPEALCNYRPTVMLKKALLYYGSQSEDRPLKFLTEIAFPIGLQRTSQPTSCFLLLSVCQPFLP
jgi:hypothetical protein